MKYPGSILGIVILTIITWMPGCTNAYKQRYIARHVLGLSDKEIDLAGRAKPVPFEDLRFDVRLTRKTYTVQISSEKWEILGFGTTFTGTKSTNELMLDGIAGIPNTSGGTKSYTDERIPGRNLHVAFLNEDGTQREIFRER